jgi:hypothetical protein
LTREPCPGGSAACTGGGAVRESFCSAFASGALAAIGGGGGNGGGAETLEILIETILSWISCLDCVPRRKTSHESRRRICFDRGQSGATVNGKRAASLKC